MIMKTRSDFTNHDEWHSYVRENIPLAERSYALACGRTELFKSFYAAHNKPFPPEFGVELERIYVLTEPKRSEDLDALNQRILEGLGGLLRVESLSKATAGPGITPESPGNDVQRLLDHLVEKNPYFAFWAANKNRIGDAGDRQTREDFLSKEIEPESEDEEGDIAFTRAMGELDRLLSYFLSHKLPLPEHFFDRCWFLHYLKEPERMLHTRVLLNTLAAEIEPCASA
jgi:hypothetical protein